MNIRQILRWHKNSHRDLLTHMLLYNYQNVHLFLDTHRRQFISMTWHYMTCCFVRWCQLTGGPDAGMPSFHFPRFTFFQRYRWCNRRNRFLLVQRTRYGHRGSLVSGNFQISATSIMCMERREPWELALCSKSRTLWLRRIKNQVLYKINKYLDLRYEAFIFCFCGKISKPSKSQL